MRKGKQRTRRRHLDEVDTVDSARLNMIVPVATKRALERLAERYAVTQREMLGKLIGDTERAATNGMPSADLRRYYGDVSAGSRRKASAVRLPSLSRARKS